MKRMVIGCLIAFAAMLSVVVMQGNIIDSLRSEKKRYEDNFNAVESSVREYRTRDSLHAAEAYTLCLELEEYKRMKVEDAALIESLRTKGRNIHSVTTAATITDIPLHTIVYDSVVVNNYIVDTLSCINISNEWYTLRGCIEDDTLNGTLTTYDSLLVAVSVKYKRFLGFLWKTSKIKDSKVDVVSRNPYTRIKDIQYIYIK